MPLVVLALLGVGLASVGNAAVKSVVLVHGAFANGSGWKPVADALQHDGYTVFVAQGHETTFEANVAATRLVLDRAGPCVLVGHSYGGMIIAEAGVHPQPPTASSRSAWGYLQVKPESFPEGFAADAPKPLARFMAISQVPISIAAFGAKATAQCGPIASATKMNLNEPERTVPEATLLPSTVSRWKGV